MQNAYSKKPKKMSDKKTKESIDTRQTILNSATHLFASGGFDAISNRQIASDADTNQALIGYHFGSKRGLYTSVLERMVEDLSVQLKPAMEELISTINQLKKDINTSPEYKRRNSCIECVSEMLCAHIKLLIRPELEDYAKLIMREQLEPSDAFSILWEGYLEKQLLLLSQIIAICHGNKKTTKDDRLQAITLMSQAVIFRVARATVSMHMNWPDKLDQKNVTVIEKHIRKNVKSVLS